MASLTTGKTHIHDCTVDNPNSLRFCDRTVPFRHILKFVRQLSAAVSDHGERQLPDLRHAGCRPVPRAAVLRGEPDGDLGGPRAHLHRRDECDRQPANLNLLAPNSIFADYYKIFDIRVSKSMTIGRHNINALAEFDNLFNMRNVVAVTENYGTNWLRPASVQRGRNIRFGIQYRF